LHASYFCFLSGAIGSELDETHKGYHSHGLHREKKDYRSKAAKGKSHE